MEIVLDVYKRPYDEKNPVVCMDESPKQIIKETRASLPMEKGIPVREDYEYERCGVCNIFMANEPLKGNRIIKITERKTKEDWAIFMKEISENYSEADKITIVMDNFKTHSHGAFYEAFEPEEAKKLLDRFEFINTPKHGSWLNMAEIELNVLQNQCLKRHFNSMEEIIKESQAWQNTRNNKNAKIKWRFTTKEARIKLKRLYPSFEN